MIDLESRGLILYHDQLLPATALRRKTYLLVSDPIWMGNAPFLMCQRVSIAKNIGANPRRVSQGWPDEVPRGNQPAQHSSGFTPGRVKPKEKTQHCQYLEKAETLCHSPGWWEGGWVAKEKKPCWRDRVSLKWLLLMQCARCRKQRTVPW